ncbi:ubiquitin ligase SCF complex subunit Cullin [Rhizoctonia solani AG-1 IA]|uniref:Ubiquitin ligase SCF complex subunit Cullin n=1 Tax=Thanatephorus cucumeris (strain AG1-IA) TaxID=983506 RepID=L8WRL8_THACA|nr:ubiquitin ligase SCF complex subunit Cullin [Rhizoctonia solani AG-1 IA]
MFGLAAAIKGYGQMLFGKDVVDSGIKRTNFKAVYIPTWKVDCITSFTSDLGDSDHPTVMHLREVTVPGINHHPLARWVKSFPTDTDEAKPFSKNHLEPLSGTYDILALPFTTSPLAAPQALKEAPYGDIEITEGWSIDPRSVEFQMLAAYPLLHPVFLAEYTLGEKHITVLAHGYHDYFSVWGHASHPDVWVNAEQGATVTYLRASKPIVGGPAAMPNFIDEENTVSNIERIAREPDMSVSDCQANATRNWMTLAGKVDEIGFIIESIPAANARIVRIEVAPGLRAKKSEVGTDPRAPLKKQLEELKEEAERANYYWATKALKYSIKPLELRFIIPNKRKNSWEFECLQVRHSLVQQPEDPRGKPPRQVRAPPSQFIQTGLTQYPTAVVLRSKLLAWEKLSVSIQQIYAKNASSLSFEENYRHAYNLVIAKQGKMLYDGLVKLICENLDIFAREKLIPVFPRTELDGRDSMEMCQAGELFVKVFREVWDDHESSMSKISDLVKYMSANVPKITEQGSKLFLSELIHSTKYPILAQLNATILLLIRMERNGTAINRSAMKQCVDVLLTLRDTSIKAVFESTVYKLNLESEILQESDIYYTNRAKEMLDLHDLSEYLKLVRVQVPHVISRINFIQAESFINAEQDRTHSYLSFHTSVPLQNILISKILTPHTARLLKGPEASAPEVSSALTQKQNTALDLLIDTERTEDLARLLRMFQLPPEESGIKLLRLRLKESIIGRGKTINEECDEDAVATTKQSTDGKKAGEASAKSMAVQTAIKWMTDVLALKDHFDRLLANSWGGEVSMQTAINEAFESFINMNKRAAEFVSLFIDDHLKKGTKLKTESEMNTLIDRTISIFRFISDKDVFERYYKTHLAKRLLQSRTTDDEAEREMIGKLKIECGFAFTQKLEGMFHDIRLSGELTDSFRGFIQRVTEGDDSAVTIDMQTSILTAGIWPITNTTDFGGYIMPPIIAKHVSYFERFYNTRHSGRKLSWQPNYGSADIRVAFKTRKHELNLTTAAMIVFLEIKEATGLPDVDLQRQLQSLACAKYKVLRKHPASRSVSTTDTFTFNYDFTAPLQRIKIQTVASKAESNEERRETEEKVEEERKLQTEACIVRVMKDRKHMAHNDLINEVTRQLASRFTPVPVAIKKRIEALIERGGDKKSYNYLVPVIVYYPFVFTLSIIYSYSSEDLRYIQFLYVGV